MGKNISKEQTVCARGVYPPLQQQAIQATEKRIAELDRVSRGDNVACMTNRLHKTCAQQTLQELESTQPQIFRKAAEALLLQDKKLFTDPEKYESDIIDLTEILKNPTGEITYAKWQLRLQKN